MPFHNLSCSPHTIRHALSTPKPRSIATGLPQCSCGKVVKFDEPARVGQLRLSFERRAMPPCATTGRVVRFGRVELFSPYAPPACDSCIHLVLSFLEALLGRTPAILTARPANSTLLDVGAEPENRSDCQIVTRIARLAAIRVAAPPRHTRPIHIMLQVVSELAKLFTPSVHLMHGVSSDS